MKYLDEFGNPDLAKRLLEQIHDATTGQWALMEVCGGQTHSIIRHGIDQLLPDGIELIHGPGCPVCVTPEDRPRPGHCSPARGHLLQLRDMIRARQPRRPVHRQERGWGRAVVYPRWMRSNSPRRTRIGRSLLRSVETTAPANAMTVVQARRLGIENFSLLVSHVLVPPAIAAIMESPTCRVQAFLAAGHVCSVMGTAEYHPLAAKYGVPIVVTGFEPLDLLEGIRRTVVQLEEGRHEVENAYPRAVPDAGNPAAQAVLADVFTVTDRTWRGIGEIPASGWRLADGWAQFDAEHRFDVSGIRTEESPLCRSGEVLQGLIKPTECAAFGKECTPRTPLGATMVSSEGACAAYYNYRRLSVAQ